MKDSLKGYILGIISAVTYGMNPLFGIHLYDTGMNPASVLFYRFAFASAMLAAYMLFTGKTFVLQRKQIPFAAAAGILLALSCLTWFMSFKIMDSGIGATLLFVYPVMVAAIMAAGYHERLTAGTGAGIALALAGVAMLCRPGGGAEINLAGVAYVLVSALTYAVYIVGVKESRLKLLEPETLTFYAMLSGSFLIFAILGFGRNIQMLPGPAAVGNALGLAFFPSLLSFLLMAVAIRYIGATKTAVLGALEPVTAVAIGVLVFSEKFTLNLFAGIVLILFSVFALIFSKSGKPCAMQ